MTLKELLADESIKSEIDEAIKKTEPKNDKEWIEALVKEAANRGIEINENEIRALLVEKMPIDEEAMENIAGGRKVYSDGYSDCEYTDYCWSDMGCTMVVSSCHYNYTCFSSYTCEIVVKWSMNCSGTLKIPPEDR